MKSRDELKLLSTYAADSELDQHSSSSDDKNEAENIESDKEEQFQNDQPGNRNTDFEDNMFTSDVMRIMILMIEPKLIFQWSLTKY